MSVNLPATVAALFSIMTIMTTSEMGASHSWAGVAGVVAGLLFLILYIYSPLPSHNGGFGAPPARLQKWGFTSEPQDGYEEPTTEEILSPAVPSGFSFAKRSEDDE